MVKLNRFDKNAWLRMKQTQDLARKADKVLKELGINSNKIAGDELMISGSNLNQPGESSPYIPFDKNHPEHPDYEPPKTQEQYDQLTLPIELANLKKLNELANMQEFKNGGRVAPNTGAFINNVGEAWIRMPDGRLKFDGLYNKEVHGPVFPMDQVKNNSQNELKIAQKRLPFINIDNLEDPLGTLKDGGYGDPDVMDFPSGGNYRKGSDVLDRLIDLELVNRMKINPKRA